MFDLSEIDLNEAFGLTAENPAGGNEADAADQPQNEDTQGENESDAADQTETEDEGGEDDSSADPDEGKEAKKQTKEDNARFAAARRKAEAEVDKRVKEALDGRFARMELNDPYTGKKITTTEEFDAYLSKLESERRESMAKKAGMSKEDFDEYIQSQPEVKEARAAQEQARRQAAQAQIAEELKEISALDPSIHELGDIAKSDKGAEINELINRGYRLVDAFKLANFDRLRDMDESAIRQRTINSAAGKSHLTSTKSRGQGMTSVPRDTMDTYRIFFPDMSDSDIQKEYNRWEKNT